MFKLLFVSSLLKILLTTNASVEFATENQVYEGFPIILIESQPNTFDIPADWPDFDGFADSQGNLLGKAVFQKQFSKAIFFCPKDPSDDTHVLYPTKFDEEDSLFCKVQPNPVIKKIEENTGTLDSTNQQGVNCGFEKIGTPYKYVYELYPDNTNTELKYPAELEMYRLCYDHQSDKVLYVKYQIKSALLLQKDVLKTEREKDYNPLTDGFQYFQDTFIKKKKLYQELETLREEHITYTKYRNKISTMVAIPFQAEKLVNANDMAFAAWRKPTFHFINVDLMNKNLKKDWDIVNFIIKMKAIEEPSVPFTIYTGAYTITGPVFKRSYLNDQVQIPYAWIKVVIRPLDPRDLTKGYLGSAIVVNNYEDNDQLMMTINEQCKDTEVMKNVDYYFKAYARSGSKYVRYCDLTEGFKQLFDLDVPIVGKIVSYKDGIGNNNSAKEFLMHQQNNMPEPQNIGIVVM